MRQEIIREVIILDKIKISDDTKPSKSAEEEKEIVQVSFIPIPKKNH
jgi:hypothetical protein